MPSRRSFLMSAAASAIVVPRVPVPPFAEGAGRALRAAAGVADDRPPEALAEDETYWGEIQRAFDADRTMINLNNGGVSPTPTHVLEAMIRDLRFTNELPVEHMWRVLEPRVESVRRELAREFGCDPEEMAVVRNASEANETMILGLDLRRGDEVVVTTQNYPRMLTAWEQRVRRDGITLRSVRFDVPSTDDHVFERVTAAVTPRTRAIELPHITNLTGQVLPIRRLQAFARQRGIALLVDGAHAFAHFPFTRDALDCDYYGTSLHKWLLAPIGTGFLYVRRDRIASLWPLMAAPKAMDADVRKYEEIGTHPAANHNAVAAALAFHRAIGAERKAARLRWLRDRWARALLAESDRVKVLTPLDDPTRAGAIGFFAVEGLDPGKLGGWLLAKHHVVTTPIVFPEFSGIRITPNVYTTRDEVDRFAELVASAIRKGIA
ncbi:aminotransferase class V-fold PLP-dependent enzyme [Roseisolibacter sp. H3M3-2]|uniref:aminotransferase class V-fold PLP-dependent enzyme n=1 Tax=Roseisolibacter sp. H3M3-2 TaxID=3031323 RepID=UPI0023DB5F08|nr:aminotransferase class V-fold PLP-dependent enzyme [Roseisolibacter sp. H3M3-2]MDF1505117.1 aminotransferase class V-fold PLP-dependent enzyme [Roseisolibacter sp. H3M3-2]